MFREKEDRIILTVNTNMSKSQSPDLSLVLACYNEGPVFRDSVSRIVRTLDLTNLTWELIFVDDRSADRTPELIRSLVKGKDNMKALFHTVNTGRGKAVCDGMLLSTGTVTGYIDIDLEVSPVYIPQMADEIMSGRADLVIGKRIYRTTLVSIVREVLSAGYRWLSDRLIDTGGFDTESGYKFANRKKIIPVLADIRNKQWFFDTEIVVRARQAGLKVKELPVLFMRRFDKQSSVDVFRDVPQYLAALWEFRRNGK